VSLQLLCWETWPGRHLLTKDLDRTAPNDVVETLSMKTGFAVPEIQQMTIQSMEGALFEDCSSGSARLPWILPVHLRTDRGNGIQYCSDCLKEGVPYFRILWRLSFITCCSKHNKILLDRCTSCHRALNPYACFGGFQRNTGPVPVYLCRWCGWDLRDSGSTDGPCNLATSKVAKFQEKLERGLDDGWVQLGESNWIHSILWFQGLQRLTRHLSSRGSTKRIRGAVMELLAMPIDQEYELALEESPLFEQLPAIYRYKTMEMLQWLLADWPTRFVSACNRAHLRQARLLSDSSKQAPYWLWVVGQEHLSCKYQKWREAILPHGMTLSYRDLGERLTNSASHLRERRRQFIRDHPELHENPQRLLQEMKLSNLYSPNSELSILLKHIGAGIRSSSNQPSLFDACKVTPGTPSIQ